VSEATSAKYWQNSVGKLQLPVTGICSLPALSEGAE
jgi:hypothetical protein